MAQVLLLVFPHMLEWLGRNLDFLIFSGAALLIFGAGEGWLRRTGRGGIPPLVWGLAVTILVVCWFPVQAAGDRRKSHVQTVAETFVRLYALEFEKLGHEQVVAGLPPDDPLYLRLIETQKEWLTANPLVHDIYTMRRTPEGKVAHIVDSETDYNHDGKYEGEIEQRPPLGDIYEEAGEYAGLSRALQGSEAFDRVPVTDKWGTWVSAWAPLRNSSGQIEAALGVAYDADTYLAAAAEGRHRVLALISLPLLILLGAAGFVAVQKRELERRAAATAAMRETQRRFTALMDHSPVVAFLKDATGRYLYANRKCEELYRQTSTQLQGKQDRELMSAELAARLGRADARVREENHPIELQETVPNAEGEPREWWVSKFPIDDGAGGCMVGGIAHDVTDKLRLEEDLRHSQKLQTVGQLAAGIAHDFNNLLTVIVGCSEVLKDPALPRAEIAEHAGRAGQAAERAATLVRQLLAFSRRQVLFPREIELNELVSGLEPVLRRVLGEPVAVVCHLSAELPSVQADPAMIEQVLVNLALNSRDAMPMGGTFSITTAAVVLDSEAVKNHAEARAGSFVRITVRDTGIGMVAATLSRLFEPFFTTKDVGQGTGMGLATVYGIVKQHEGWIEARSAPGEGAAFYLFLPAPMAKVAAEAGEIPSPHAGTILLVEDDTEVRFMVKRLLIKAGYAVREAGSGAQAKPVWAECREEITLLLTDMVMPDGVNGRELAESFRAERPDLRVLFTSGYSADLLDRDLLAQPGTRFLQKPFGPRDLREALEDLLVKKPAVAAERPG